jgi:hypothetical protein
MFREIVVPTEKNHIIELPESMYGKTVEVIAFEIQPEKKSPGRENFLGDIEPIPDFPSLEQIRKEGWPKKW